MTELQAGTSNMNDLGSRVILTSATHGVLVSIMALTTAACSEHKLSPRHIGSSGSNSQDPPASLGQ